MLRDTMLAYAEIDEILNLLEDKYKEKVPEEIRNFFHEEKMKNYEPKIDINTPLIEQNLKKETLELLAILNINYWCETEEEKKIFLNEIAKNEREKRLLEEKYNPDNLFKNNQKSDTINKPETEDEMTQMVEYKQQNLFYRILNKIFSFFKKDEQY